MTNYGKNLIGCHLLPVCFFVIFLLLLCFLLFYILLVMQKNLREDSGIYAMMFLEQWKSPRTVLRKIFDSTNIANIRVKIANGLMFLPGNSGSE
jgi:hypothetical protein